ncbi:JK_30P [Escherichia phage Jk06]|uniref:JK_30P n=1 Tax=Escherichia phage Jk06 TaxID=2886922 RepID=Q45PY5_9CAUD|nr:hypothetical protein JK_30 [Escherichia phage Jk06]AAZ29280.1 JK_30P [Escherichia phage Jk06]
MSSLLATTLLTLSLLAGVVMKRVSTSLMESTQARMRFLLIGYALMRYRRISLLIISHSYIKVAQVLLNSIWTRNRKTRILIPFNQIKRIN